MAKKRPVKKRRSTGTGAGGGPFLFKKPHEAITWMNKRYAVVSEGNRVLVISEALDPVLRRKWIVRYSFADIKKLQMNRRVITGTKSDGEPDVQSLPDFWFQDPRRRQFDGVVFAPGGDPPGMFNLWRGFEPTPKRGDCARFYEHIRANICSGNAHHYDYVLNWMAKAVQDPGERGEVALVMQGGQGTGKGIFAREYGKLWSQHFLPITHARHLVGHFNAHLQDAVVLFADEAFPPDRGVELPCTGGLCGFSRIVQTSGSVAIYYKMGHSGGAFRTILISARQHLPPHMRFWLGDAVGRWEGDTLVVDTTNFTDRTEYRGLPDEQLHLVERFTRISEDDLRYQITVDKPDMYTRPWTMEFILMKADVRENLIFESACHEGNYSMTSMLAGARRLGE